MKNSTHGLEGLTLLFSSYKNHELKVKPWLVRAGGRKKSPIFVTFILSEYVYFYISKNTTSNTFVACF